MLPFAGPASLGAQWQRASGTMLKGLLRRGGKCRQGEGKAEEAPRN